MKDFTGVYTALVTPFKDGEVDTASLKKLVKFQLDRGVQGFVICGTTAESPCLSKKEKEQVFKTVEAEAGGQVPLIMGTGSNNTRETIEATKDATFWGADAALVVVPYYNKPPQRGLEQHYRAIADASEIPVMLYNVPSRTITKLELETIISLSHHKNIVGIKDAIGDMDLARKTLEQSRDGFVVTSGDDATYLDLVTEGGHGVISVASHILPREFVTWYRKAHATDTSWKSEFTAARSLIDYLYVEANPIPVKMALALMGVIATPEMRLPLAPLIEPYTTELKTRMQKQGLL
jgi:4-hydroxy-tetrahydrodipicolinate synthase